MTFVNSKKGGIKERDSAEKSKISCHAILSQITTCNFKEYCFIRPMSLLKIHTGCKILKVSYFFII